MSEKKYDDENIVKKTDIQYLNDANIYNHEDFEKELSLIKNKESNLSKKNREHVIKLLI